MKKILIILTIFLSLIPLQNIRAQELVRSKNDSLSIFLEQHDLVSFFNRVTVLADIAYVHSNADSLLLLSHLLQLDFGEMNFEQMKILRLSAAKLGQKISKLTGNVEESLKIYLVAHDHVQNKTTLDSLAWFIENPIASLYTMTGDYEKAEYFGTALESSLKYYKMNEFLSRYYTNLGIKLKSQLKIEQAITIFEKGYKLADSIHYNKGIFANVLNLASLYDEHPNLGSAESYLLQAGNLLSTFSSDARYLEAKSTFEIESANFKSIQGNYSESIPLYKEGIQTLSQYFPSTSRREFAKYYTSLASAYIHTDSFEAADRVIHLAIRSLIPDFNEQDEIPFIHQLYPENSFIDLLDLKAQVFEQEFSFSSNNEILEKALKCIELALDVNDMIRETVIADPSKLVSISSNKELIGKGIAILYRLYQGNRNKNVYFDRARSFFNRSKSLLFNDKTRRNSLAGIISAADKEKWAALQDSMGQLYDKKFESGANINIINGDILFCQEKIDKLFAAYNDVLLNSNAPDQYIEYFMSDEEIYSLSILNGQRTFLKIGLQYDFKLLAERLDEYILLKGFSLDNTVLNDMFMFLIKSVSDRLPDHVVIIPDGPIGYVPFEMLKDGGGKYLLETTTISYSFEYISSDDEFGREDKAFSVFCLAPQYKAKELNVVEVSRGSLFDLPYAKIEVDSISALYGASARTSQSTSKDELEQNLSDAYIFHYAGHAIIGPDKAFLALTDSGAEIQQLTLNEIGLRHHSLDLVVLSACETGLGKLEQGEGIRSLGRSFMESGAKSTVISLWNVNDKSTAVIMTGFYKYMRKGWRKDDALRQSKLDYLKNSTIRNANPYFWAAFIPAGDMKALEEK